MKYRAPLLPLLALAALIAAPAHAQDVPAAPDGDARDELATTVFDTITVMGTRTEVSVQDSPVSISIVDRAEIERKAPESVTELLRDLPGVQIVDTSAGGMKRLRIRGESSRRVTILIDGQELTDHSTSGTPLLVDPANVERIEVVRGSASVLYGSKAIGGVINIVTRKGAPVPLELEGGAVRYSGSDGWQGWGAASGTRGNVDYRVSAGANIHHDREVPKGPYSDTGTLENTSYRNSDAAVHLGYRFGAAGNHYLAFKTERHWLDTRAWTDPFSFEYPVTDFGVDLPQRDLSKYGLYYDADELGPVLRKVHVDVYRQKVDRLFNNHVTMKPIPSTEVGIVSTSDDLNTNLGGTVQADFAWHPAHYAIVGLHYLGDDLDTFKTTTTDTSINQRPPFTTRTARRDRASVRSVSGFVQDEWTVAEHLKLAGGLRWYHARSSLDSSSEEIRPDQRRQTVSNLVKSFDATWTGWQDTTLRALYSEGYIMPTLLELFTDNSAGRGVVTHGNPELQPETSRNVELGLRTRQGGWLLDLATYVTHARNYITTNPCSQHGGCPATAVPGSFIYVNADRARTVGLEFLAEYGFRDTGFTAYASGAWAERRLTLAGQSAVDTSWPRLTGRLGLRYERTGAGHDLWLDAFTRAATHTSRTFDADGQHWLVNEAQALAGWATLNLALGANFEGRVRQRVGLHLNNLLDKGYRTSMDELPGLGRNVEVTWQVVF